MTLLTTTSTNTNNNNEMNATQNMLNQPNSTTENRGMIGDNSSTPLAHFEKAESIHEEVINSHPEEEKEQKRHDRSVIIAVDGSECSQYAFEWALDNILRSETDQVSLIHVRPYVMTSIMYGIPHSDFYPEYMKIEEGNRTYSHNLLKSYAKKLLARDFKCKGIALKGEAKEEIVNKCKKVNADLLIVGCRGMGMIKRALVGSVSDYCIHHAHCPVLVPKK